VQILQHSNEIELLRNPYKFNFACQNFLQAPYIVNNIYNIIITALLYYANTNKKGLKAICVGRAFKPNYRK